ncbi:hypothetical protein J2X12_002871 [Pseudarthrobacter oxydans]|uniref:Uncharacterized protein n=1 Tax=Pseudarthrobacter oxydans TaxID=1671 RepID=A0AAW8NB42_PSEOX|nr:hypothetical protein [Pseudarthrobacter oxydans]MDR6794392.1 hypothetical protein [Pseudarthrobacter oxydans]MDR7164833.1 hypothetical protein [Pseudarthrobacter oxydans]
MPITQIWHHDYADGTPGLVTVLTKRGYVEYDGSSLVTVQGW